MAALLSIHKKVWIVSVNQLSRPVALLQRHNFVCQKVWSIKVHRTDGHLYCECHLLSPSVRLDAVRSDVLCTYRCTFKCVFTRRWRTFWCIVRQPYYQTSKLPINYSLKIFITTSEVWDLTPRTFGQPVRRFTAMREYPLPGLVMERSPAKTIVKVWNRPGIGWPPAEFSSKLRLKSWKEWHGFTYARPFPYTAGHREWLATKSMVCSACQYLKSSSMAHRTFSLFLWDNSFELPAAHQVSYSRLFMWLGATVALLSVNVFFHLYAIGFLK